LEAFLRELRVDRFIDYTTTSVEEVVASVYDGFTGRP
jgi:hypothetical protein